MHTLVRLFLLSLAKLLLGNGTTGPAGAATLLCWPPCSCLLGEEELPLGSMLAVTMPMLTPYTGNLSSAQQS